MKFDNVKNVPCIGQKPVEVVDDPPPPVEPTESTKCEPCKGDMEWAALVGTDHCVNPPTIEKLYIKPESITSASFGTVQYDAYIQFKYHPEGTTCPSKVTGKVSWTSSNTDVAAHEENGLFKLARVDVETTLTVTAHYTPTVTVAGVEKKHTEELFATASLVVKPDCKGVAVDIVLVVDRSGSMLKKDQSGGSQTSRLEAAKRACELLAKNSKIEGGQEISTEDGSGNYERDRVAIVTYAGSAREGGDDGKRAEVHSKFLESYTAVEESVKTIQVAEECKGKGKLLSGCWTGMGYGLQTAYDLLQAKGDGGDARETATETSTSPRKLIILLTDGHENVCDPDPIVVAGDIRKDRTGGDQDLLTVAHDTMIAVVGYLLDSGASIKRCNGTTTTVGGYLSLVANCYGRDSQGDSGASTALTYFPQDEAELKEVYQGILDSICEDNVTAPIEGRCHYIDGSGLVSSDIQPVTHFKYEGFKNWNVVKNSVDWMGGNLWTNLIPTAGRYVGLIGGRGGPQLENSPTDNEVPVQSNQKAWWDDAYEQKNCQIMTAPYDHNFGGIETKPESTFVLDSTKQYRLTIQYAGNGTKKMFPHGNDLNSSIRITVGGEQSGAAIGDKVVEATVDDSLEVVDGIPMTVTTKIPASTCTYIEVLKVEPEQKLTSDALTGTIESIVDPTPNPVGGDWQASKTHPAFLATSTTSTKGTGAKYKVVTNGSGKPTFTQKDGGSGYVAGDTLTFTDPGSSVYTAVITVGVAKDVEATHFVRDFWGKDVEAAIRIEQYPAKYKEYINPGSEKKPNKKYIYYDIPAEDYKVIFTELKDANGEVLACNANPRVDLTDFSGFTSLDGLLVYGDSNENLRHETSGADEFLANSPYGVNISNVKLEELDADGDPLKDANGDPAPLFNDDFSA